MGKIKKAVIGTLGALAIYETFIGHEGDFPPFYTKKIGTICGICLAGYVNIDSGATFYGPVISLWGKK